MTAMVRAALRQLRRSPGFFLVGSVSLGIGIAAVTAVFSLVNGLFFRTPPGIENADRLVTVEASVSSYPNFRDLREGVADVVELAAFSDHLLGIEAEGRSRQLLGLFVSPGYFRVLGTRAAVGRVLGGAASDREERGGGAEVVLSHRAWRRYFSADSSVLGRAVRVNGTPLTVVGVAEEGFHGSFVGFQFDVWIPVSAAPMVGGGLDPATRDLDRLELVGRTRPDVRIEQVRAALTTAAAGLRREFPGVNSDLRVTARRYDGFDEEVRGPALALAGVLLAVATLVLLVATVNVMGLQLARSVARSADTALRRALGGRTRDVVGPVLVESLAVAAAGALVAVGALRWLSVSLSDLIPEFPVQLALDFPVDARVVGFAAVVTLVGGIGAGLLPALRARGASLRGLLGNVSGEEPAGLRGLRAAVGLQVAVSVVLLATAGVFVQTLAEARAGDPGFRTEDVWVAPFLDLSAAGLGPDEAPRLYEELRRRLSGVPSVEDVALATRVPMGFAGRAAGRVELPGRRLTPEGEGLEVEVTAASPGYFSTLGIPILEGRALRADASGDGESGVLVSRELARVLWGDSSPLNQRLVFQDSELRVVGVGADVRHDALRQGARPHLYVDLRAFPDLRPTLLVRSRSPGVAGSIRRGVADVEPGLPAPELQSMESFLGIALVPQRLGSKIGGFLGLLSLLLAGVGLYATIAFWVGRRRREIGIRMAIGADPARVFRTVVGRGLVLAAWGTGVGLLVALAATSFLEGAVRGVSGAGLLVLGTVTGVVLLTVLLAAAVPARRAAALDPARTLRAE